VVASGIGVRYNRSSRRPPTPEARMYEPDVAVIGGGATGLGAALHARRAGADVVLIERDRLGGDCTWTGCVPSKTIIEHARRVHHARSIGAGVDVDTSAVLEHARAVVHRIAREEDADTLAKFGVRVLTGQARFLGHDRLDVDGTQVTPGATIVATGSTAVVPDLPGLRASDPLTNETVFSLRLLPGSLAVLGAGAIGLELGQAFARLGTRVALVDLATRVAPMEEPETSRTLTDALTGEGIDVHTGVRVESVRVADGKVELIAGGTPVATAERAFVAVGRRPVTDGLDLERAGVDLADDGTIPVDARMRTAVRGILAAGDVTAHPRLTHAGYRMGQIAAHTALRRSPWKFAPEALPWAVFTDPEVGRVGLTEAQAFTRWGADARVVVFPMRRTDRARMSGTSTGFVKLVAAPHPVTRGLLGGRLVGATIVCPGAGEAIGELALAVRSRTLLLRLAQTVHAYPPWSFGVWEAVARFFGTHKSGSARPARAG
jgi:pyruvate/2-oxoglutarate dehydrogenase complex dihydrolipoamide dehydrogenase (E3) component